VTFLVLNLSLDIFDLSEDSTPRAMVFPVRALMKICLPPRRRRTRWSLEGGLLLDIVIRQSAPFLELLVGKDETLLISRILKGKIRVSPSAEDDWRDGAYPSLS
jgi:hypothetical protein